MATLKARGRNAPVYKFEAAVTNVVDGDTIDCCIDQGFYNTTTQRIRINGIQCAEKRPRTGTPEHREAEKEMAAIAEEYVRDTIAATGTRVWLKTYKGDSFGRWLADVYLSAATTITLSSILLKEGLAVSYKHRHDVNWIEMLATWKNKHKQA